MSESGRKGNGKVTEDGKGEQKKKGREEAKRRISLYLYFHIYLVIHFFTGPPSYHYSSNKHYPFPHYHCALIANSAATTTNLILALVPDGRDRKDGEMEI